MISCKSKAATKKMPLELPSMQVDFLVRQYACRLLMALFLILASAQVSALAAKRASSYYDSLEQAKAAYQSADYKKAASLFKGALKDCEETERGTIEEIRTLNDLTASYCCADELSKAQDRCAQALALCVSSLKQDDPLLVKTKQRNDFLASQSTKHMHKTELREAWLKFDGSLMQHPSDVTPGANDTLPADAHGELTRKHKEPSFLKRLISKVHFWKLSYYFVAQNASNCDLFYGLIQDDPLIGHASVDFVFANGCDCHGYGQVTHYPWFSGSGGAGQGGVIKAKCSDGRALDGTFETTSVTTGHGTVTDSNGNQYQFTFGHTIDEAIQKVNELRKKLGCEPANAEEIEMKVNAQILNRSSGKSKNSSPSSSGERSE